MKSIKLQKLELTRSEMEKLGKKDKKRYIMFTFMVRDLNVLQKCLMFANNESAEGVPSTSAKCTTILFFLKTLISKIFEMWIFLKNNKIIKDSESFSEELKKKCGEIEQFFSDKKIKDIVAFIRNNFGFHYEYQNNVDASIEEASKRFSEFEIWLSADSANEIFSSSNAVVMEVIFSKMRELGFLGDRNALMLELHDLTLKAAHLLREFIIDYIAEAFEVSWEKREQVQIEVPQLSQVTLPLIVAE